MRHYDHTVNVLFAMEHFNAAAKYLIVAKSLLRQLEEASGRNICIQSIKRVFFPDLWSAEELETWGETKLENHKILTKFENILI